MKIETVLDASAFLAYLRDERGAEIVADAISGQAAISTVNLAEVLSKVASYGLNPDQLREELTESGLLDGALVIEPFSIEDATAVARLRPKTQDAGLSLGDRACLALASRLNAIAVTADRAWQEVELGVQLELIR